jgi:hypothetical protein
MGTHFLDLGLKYISLIFNSAVWLLTYYYLVVLQASCTLQGRTVGRPNASVGHDLHDPI